MFEEEFLMRSKSSTHLSGKSSRRWLNFVACLLGLAIITVSASTIQTKLQAATKKKNKNRVLNVQDNSGIRFLPLKEEPPLRPNFTKGQSLGQDARVSPLAIPAGTPINKVSF